MSAQNFDDPEDPVVEGFGVPENCFLCLKPLAGWGVLWHAPGQTIGLHPDCATRLSKHVDADAKIAAWQRDMHR